jgi:hypothetical protein
MISNTLRFRRRAMFDTDEVLAAHPYSGDAATRNVHRRVGVRDGAGTEQELDLGARRGRSCRRTATGSPRG